MSQREDLIVTDKDGVCGEIDITPTPPFDGSSDQVLVNLADGRHVIVPTEALVSRKEHGFFLPLSLSELMSPQRAHSIDESRAQSNGAQRTEAMVVPVVAEELQIDKRRIETGRVRITKRVHEREEVFDEPLLREEVDVERVAVNQFVDTAPPIRYEGDTMIIPLLEEVLVVEKRLMLKEELRVKRRQSERHEPQRVTLRREEVSVERVDSEA